jgi:ring-1,2-phenylacetyl-CoA epoxidase subunit PaaC
MSASADPLLAELLLALGDDELILGHRDSEWCGQAPILEEDIAFANIALDEIGHASIWYTLLAETLREDPQRYPDQLVYTRAPAAWRCAQIVEHPRGDWAFTILRQYLADSAEARRLGAFLNSSFIPLREGADKIKNEEIYHHWHTRAWVQRLGLGTDESNHRMQIALESLWPLTHQWFQWTQDDSALAMSGNLPPGDQLHQEWWSEVASFLEECNLQLPRSEPGRLERSKHTPHLKSLLAEMQSVARLDPEARW